MVLEEVNKIDQCHVGKNNEMIIVIFDHGATKDTTQKIELFKEKAKINLMALIHNKNNLSTEVELSKFKILYYSTKDKIPSELRNITNIVFTENNEEYSVPIEYVLLDSNELLNSMDMEVKQRKVEKKNSLLLFLYVILTLGFYNAYWYYDMIKKLNNEGKDFGSENTIVISYTLFGVFILLGIITQVSMFALLALLMFSYIGLLFPRWFVRKLNNYEREFPVEENISLIAFSLGTLVPINVQYYYNKNLK